MITEKDAWSMNGYLGIIIIVMLLGIFIFSLSQNQLAFGIICLFIAMLLATGLTVIRPNEATVVLFVGKYVGSLRKEGLVVTLPFSNRQKVSLRVQNAQSNRLQVTDINGTIFEVSSIITYKIVDSAKALFEVDHYEQFIALQSEIVVRKTTSSYAYENLRQFILSNEEIIIHEIKTELQKRITNIGIEIIDVLLLNLQK